MISIVLSVGLGVSLAAGLAWLLFAPPLPADWVVIRGLRSAAKLSPPWVLISGTAAAPPLLLTWWWRTVHKDEDIALAQRVERNSRFVDAVKLLADPNLEARLGGVYSLEALGVDSALERRRVLETLCAFVRSRKANVEPDATLPRTDTADDVQAAFSVVGRIGIPAGMRVNLVRAGLRGVNGDEVNLRGANLAMANLRDSTLYCARLQGAYLWGADLREADLRYANLRNADLTRADLRGADLRNACLDGATLGEAKLNGARLNGATLNDANLRSALLRRADLTEASLQYATLVDANMAGASAYGVDMLGANLRGADLSGADVSGTLRGANMMHADLRGTSLRGADVVGARLRDAVYDDETYLPPGVAQHEMIHLVDETPVPPAANDSQNQAPAVGE